MENIEKALDRLLARFCTYPMWVCLLPVWALFFLLLFMQQGADPDLFARVAMGRLIHTSMSIPMQDPFAYTPVKDIWIDHEWLSGLL